MRAGTHGGSRPVRRQTVRAGTRRSQGWGSRPVRRPGRAGRDAAIPGWGSRPVRRQPVRAG
ncbi:hypothetical protein DLJ47_09065 [Micromonospora sp. S4605]|nr:hypothetical protein DLJ47_09065 [Micromonospora sp. S4605]